MGLMLSILVSCVGVIELIAFYSRIKSNIIYPPITKDLSAVRDQYVQDLCGVRCKLIADLERLKRDQEQSEVSNTDQADSSSVRVSQHHTIPTFRLNSHEDIEVEFSGKTVDRSRSPLKRFLVTEDRSRSCSPIRRFVVDDFQGTSLKKSKAQECLPEFLVEEQKNSQLPRFLVKDQNNSSVPLPLPEQFIITEKNSVLESSENVEYEYRAYRTLQNTTRTQVRRSPSPNFDLPVPRNSICSELIEDAPYCLLETNDDIQKSQPPSTLTADKIDVILSSTTFDSTEYWSNKVLVVPSKKSSRTASPVPSEKEGKSSPDVAEASTSLNAKLVRHISNSDTNLCVAEPFVQQVTSSFDSESSSEGDDEWSEALQNNEQLLNKVDGVPSKKESVRKGKRSFRKRKDLQNRREGSDGKAPVESIKTNNVPHERKDAKKEYTASVDTASSGSKAEPFWVNTIN